jgi:hypothetical protein
VVAGLQVSAEYNGVCWGELLHAFVPLLRQLFSEIMRIVTYDAIAQTITRLLIYFLFIIYAYML